MVSVWGEECMSLSAFRIAYPAKRPWLTVEEDMTETDRQTDKQSVRVEERESKERV